MSKVECNLNVNGLSKKINIYEDKPLIFALRNDFGLTGTKLGCGLEQCGSCAVIIDGEKKLSCNLPAVDCQNKEIVTIEGLGTDTGLNRVQEAFKIQCCPMWLLYKWYHYNYLFSFRKERQTYF